MVPLPIPIRSPRPARPVAGLVALLLLAVTAGCGKSDEVGSVATTTPGGAATSTSTVPVERSAPRWETVTTLSGAGASRTETFPILPGAIQWRARWECETGALRITTLPPPRRGTPLVEGACPGKGEGYSIVTGSVRLVIQAAGPWDVTVDQQLDTPLREPPLEAMQSAPLLAQGDFFNVEMEGKGTARLYRLPDGTHALRFEGFEVSNNTDLFLWLSEAPSPRTSAEAVASPHVVLGNLKSTVGDQNYILPPDLPLERVKSIVIWCAPVSIAYIAAVLAPPS